MPSASNNSTSSSLLCRAKSREPAAWDRVVALYAPLIMQWCRRWGLESSEAENVCQEVFLAVSQRISGYRNDENSSFRGWLRTIARNKYVDFVRKAVKSPRAVGGSDALAALNQQIGSDENEMVAQTPAEQATDKAFLYKRAIELIKNEFSERDMNAFVLLAAQSRPPKEVASELNMSVNAVYLAKSRILRRLREEFEDLIDE